MNDPDSPAHPGTSQDGVTHAVHRVIVKLTRLFFLVLVHNMLAAMHDVTAKLPDSLVTLHSDKKLVLLEELLSLIDTSPHTAGVVRGRYDGGMPNTPYLF